MNLSEAKKKYLENPKGFRADLKEKLGIDIKQINFYEDNEPFGNMISKLEEFLDKDVDIFIYHEEDELTSHYKVKYRDFLSYSSPTLMHSIVQKPSGFSMNVHNLLTLQMNNGSFIQITPLKNNKLEISRIESYETRIGEGTRLLEILFDLLQFSNGYIPPLKAECTGAVGVGETYRSTPLDVQKKFFQKNGFVVKKATHQFVELERPRSRGEKMN